MILNLMKWLLICNQILILLAGLRNGIVRMQDGLGSVNMRLYRLNRYNGFDRRHKLQW